MLILIAGITGNIGSRAAQYALSCGHQVRGLGRSPSKLDNKLLSRLESFVQSITYYDIPALDLAVSGPVDAVICAYTGLPELGLDGQLLLLRAAERAGIKRFLAASWNYDWRKIAFGSEPIYDALIAFHAHVRITSAIKPLHIFSGMLAEVFLGTQGHAGFTPRDEGVWDPETKSLTTWGSGEEEWHFTTEDDAAKWGVELVTGPAAAEGGFVSLCSFKASMLHVKAAYEEVKGGKVDLHIRGTIQDLDRAVELKTKDAKREDFWDWHRLVFHANCVKGVWNLDNLENDRFPNVKATDLKTFIREHM